MDGLTTPKSRLMRDVCRGLAGFCAGDGKKCHARSGDRTPCSLILFQARGPGSKYHGPCGGFRAVAQSGHEGVGVAGKHQPAHGLEKSIALASADRKAGLVISMILTSAGFSNFTFRLAWNTLLNICFSCFITPEDHNPLSVARQSVCSHHHHHHHHQHSTNVYS